MIGAFPDKFLFGQGIPSKLLTQRNWKHFSLYYDGQFDDPLFIAHGFNQLQRACCIRSLARITIQPMTRFFLMKNMPKTDQLFQCHVNRTSLLWNGLTTNH